MTVRRASASASPSRLWRRKITFEQLKSGLEGKLCRDQAKLDVLAAITPHHARILNPLSHDPTTSLSEAEVITAIDAVEALVSALRIQAG
jgi:hypothetical protein